MSANNIVLASLDWWNVGERNMDGINRRLYPTLKTKHRKRDTVRKNLYR